MQVDPLIEVLITRRKMKGVSRKQMAKVAGMSEKTYQRIERGESDLKLSQYRSILRVLNLTDLDIALDARGVGSISANDVASAARLLSPEAQSMLTKLILLVLEHKTDEGKGLKKT